MRIWRLCLLVTVCAVGVASPALAQKTPPLITQDRDRDGVPDPRDACRNTPPGTRVDQRGCPIAGPTAPAAGQPAVQPAAPAQAPGQAPVQAAAPGVTPSVGVPTPITPGAQPGAGRPPGPAPDVQALKGGRPPPSGLPLPAGAVPGAHPAAPAPAQPAQAQPSQAGAVPVTPQGAPAGAVPVSPVAAAPPAGGPLEAVGRGIEPFTGSGRDALLAYARRFVLRFDSAAVALREVFVGASGLAMPGLTTPENMSRRERSRWSQCRQLFFDIQTYQDAVGVLSDSTVLNPAVRRAAAQLAAALAELQALTECDNIGSMIESPQRWQPWDGNYRTSATNFYRDWYGQLRAAHEAARTFGRMLNTMLPGSEQLPTIAALPPNPPHAGSGR